MNKVTLECQYCGHRWTVLVYSRTQIDKVECIRCDDKNVKAQVAETADIFGYNSEGPRPDAYIKKSK